MDPMDSWSNSQIMFIKTKRKNTTYNLQEKKKLPLQQPSQPNLLEI